MVPQKRLNLVYKNGVLFHFPRRASVPQKVSWKERHLHKRAFVRSTNLSSFSARNKVIPIVLFLPFVSMPMFLCASKSGPSIEYRHSPLYWGADKSLAQPTSRCILFDSENISFDASLYIYINSTNIPPIMVINRIYENQNLLLL